jgi:hypothetical protein
MSREIGGLSDPSLSWYVTAWLIECGCVAFSLSFVNSAPTRVCMHQQSTNLSSTCYEHVRMTCYVHVGLAKRSNHPRLLSCRCRSRSRFRALCQRRRAGATDLRSHRSQSTGSRMTLVRRSTTRRSCPLSLSQLHRGSRYAAPRPHMCYCNRTRSSVPPPFLLH